MNLIPIGGWWFYGGVNQNEVNSYALSYGLLADAPDTTGLYHKIRGIIGRGLKYIIGG